MRRGALTVAALGLGLAACRSCSDERGAPARAVEADPPVVGEAPPRCRAGAERLALRGEDVVVGDVALAPSALHVGVVRASGGRRLASVLSAALDLSTSQLVEVGVSFGDDPPPSPRVEGGRTHVAFYARRADAGGPRVRELAIARLDENTLVAVEATVVQQADESTAFDVAWNGAGAGLVAWDEDAPPGADAGLAARARGLVKVQAIGGGARRVASPESSDAEAPRLVPRAGGGFWLAWLARHLEEEAYAVEGPGEPRSFRWVEAVPLTATGEPDGPVRRVGSERGRATGFELGTSGDALVVLVQDETAASEGEGARIVRHVVGARAEATGLVDGGVGSGLAELVPTPAGEPNATRWLAFSDEGDRSRLVPLLDGLAPAGRASLEPGLDGARVLAAAGADRIYALSTGESGPGAEKARPELRRFTCAPVDGGAAARK